MLIDLRERTMRFFLFLTTCLFTGLLPGLAVSSEVSESSANCDGFEAAATSFADWKGLTAGFTQKAWNSFLEETIETRGTLSVQPPNLMRWEYTEGSEQLFIADGNAIWFQESPKLVRTGELARTWFPHLINALFGRIEELKEVFAIACESKGKMLNVTLTPHTTIAEVKTIVLEIHEKRQRIDAVTFTDHYEAESRIELSDVERADELPAETFVYAPPASAELVSFDGEELE